MDITKVNDIKMSTQPQFSPIEDVIADFAAGKMVILLDDEDRENEGDLTVATEKLTSSQVAFMMQEARGQICVSIPVAIAEKMALPLQVVHNASQFQTPFAVTVDSKKYIKEAATAKARTYTMKHLINPLANPTDFICGGHVYPLIVHPKGVLGRHGQTEGSHDLALMAGCFPSGVICEILNEDGTMAKGQQLAEFARKHDLKMTSVIELVKYRMANETLVKNVATRKLVTSKGTFDVLTFIDDIDNAEHIVLVKGSQLNSKNVKLAVFKEDLVRDIFDSFDSKIPLVLEELSKTESGVLIYLASSIEESHEKLSFKETAIVRKILEFLEIEDINLMTESEELLEELKALK